MIALRVRQVLFVAVGFLTVSMLSAADRVHVVASGESAASLAKTYYGNKDLGDLLLRFNGRPGKMIHPGERLTIPFCATYQAKAGDTWSAVARRQLGRAGVSSVLAELNGYAAGQPLRVGARIALPVVLDHTLARGETLSSLAERYYGDTKKAAIVQAFNRIDDAGRLAVGAVLEIPLVAFVRGEAEPAIAVTAPPPPSPPPPPEQPKFDIPLLGAARSFADGEYDRARETLEALRGPVTHDGTASDKREWGELMAFVYIALDRDADACAAYRSTPSQGKPPDFDPDLVSPRIRAALTNCSAANPRPGQLDNPAPAPQISPHAGTQR